MPAVDAGATTTIERRPSLRTILLTLLILELALVGALYLLGWFGTAGALRWAASALIAVLPLAIACYLTVSHRFRLSTRSLLILTSLFAVFVFLTVQPLYKALDARRGSRELLAHRTWISNYSSNDNYYFFLGYDPRSSRPNVAESPPMPAWLRPLAGDRLTAPVDATIQEVRLNRDAQAATFVAHAARFRALNSVSIRTATLSPGTMQRLQLAWPSLPSIVRVHVSCPVPTGWLQSLRQVKTVSIDSGSRTLKELSRENVAELAGLPGLVQLDLRRVRVAAGDLPLLAQSATLRHLTLLISGPDADEVRKLIVAAPQCRIFGVTSPNQPLRQLSPASP
ncbi:hypothetical protein [Lacipirellula limnantheis]|uniref:Uncharacterized protein n=1 Tax=Lacipirellula limnantheis TaxID=2528024 RepID=A0A517TXG8_9BACT|nr:hypothetical protein [Lacipirellula limnantheis]QDT73068.1 hypothetical protein I41_22570 [Lacipirellula limnantheis]